MDLRLVCFLVFSQALAGPIVAPLEAANEDAVLAWTGAGEEFGAVLACTGDGALLGAPGSGGTDDRFFLAIYDPPTGLWTGIVEVSGSGLSDLAISGTEAAAVIGDAVETFTWSPTGMVPFATVDGSGSKTVALSDSGQAGPLLFVGRIGLAFPVYFGAVSIYGKSVGGWVFEDNFQDDITFGWGLSAEKNEVIVGMPGSTSATGQVSKLTRATSPPYAWSRSLQFSAADGELNNSFGAAVSLSGDAFAVGVPLDDNAGGEDAGAVYLYRRECGFAFAEEAVLVSPNPITGGRFGADVSLRGPDLVVGEPGADIGGIPAAGAAHLYRRGAVGWEYVETLTWSTPGADDHLGEQVCVGEHGVLVGAPLADLAGTDAGAVLYFDAVTTLFADGFECQDMDGNGWSSWVQ